MPTSARGRAGDGARPYAAGHFPFSGPRRSPAAEASSAAYGEAKELELAATLSRCGGCSARLRASCYISLAALIFTPGPMVEAHTQERMY